MLYEIELGSVVSPMLIQELLYSGEEEERTERRRIKGRKTYTRGRKQQSVKADSITLTHQSSQKIDSEQGYFSPLMTSKSIVITTN